MRANAMKPVNIISSLSNRENTQAIAFPAPEQSLHFIAFLIQLYSSRSSFQGFRRLFFGGTTGFIPMALA